MIDPKKEPKDDFPSTIMKSQVCKTKLFTKESLKRIFETGVKVILQKQNNDWQGIAIIKEFHQTDKNYIKKVKKPYVYIDYLCTSKVCESERLRCGTHFLNYLKFHFPVIVLKTLDSSKDFYLKQGFTMLLEHNEYEDDTLVFESKN